MSTPLVSVIIPVYNAEKFIIESIESVLYQDYPNLEIVIADDCSTDNTKEILTNYFYKNNFTNIKLFINNENLGITKNCNFCLKSCTGKYVIFHAGDDIMLPGKISTQINYMEKNKECIISYHNVEVFFSDNSQKNYNYNSFWRNRPYSGKVKTLIEKGCFCCGCSVAVRRDYIPEGGYDERFSVASDWFLWISILLNEGEIHYIDKVLSRYRRYAYNTTAQNNKASLQAHLDTINVSNVLLVYYPQYFKSSLKIHSSHLKGLRKQFDKKYYNRILYESLKGCFDFRVIIALFLSVFSFGKIKI